MFLAALDHDGDALAAANAGRANSVLAVRADERMCKVTHDAAVRCRNAPVSIGRSEYLPYRI